ncbi:MAG: response regulator transcription factor [Flavobacteriales bacterium]|nr:response regulator transcription factor [Flavobacteriales bacterium]
MRIAIGDTNELDIAGLKAICMQADPSAELTVYSRCSELIRSSHSPHVILVDFTAEGYGLESLQKLRSKFPHTAILAITAIQSANTIFSAIRSGINGYVKKDCSVNEIKESILFTAQGKEFYCGDILRLLDAEGMDLLSIDRDSLDCAPLLLTEREAEILKYIAVGHTNSEIAEMLFLSSHTVNTHRKNILNKIGVNNTAAAVLYAVKEGIVDPERFEFGRN